MCSRKGKSVFSTFVFRLTIKYSILFTIVLLIVFLFGDYILSSNLLKRVEEHLIEEGSEISFLYRERDLDHVRDEIRMESEVEGVEDIFYRFRPAGANTFIQSDLTHWKSFDFAKLESLMPHPGQASFSPSKFTLTKEGVNVYLMTLEDGSFIQIGVKSDEYNELMQEYRNVFGLSILFMLAAGTGLGWFNSHQAMKGVKRVTQTALSISKGQFDQRVNFQNEGEEIDELCIVFNEMIGKVQTLIEEVKDVTNNIAHDLRSPLTRIRGLTETTMTGTQDIEEYRNMTGLVVEECDRLEHMIDTLLEIAEAEAGLTPIPKKEEDVTNIVRNGCELFQPVMEDKNISFKLLVPEEPVYLVTDQTRLQRVMANLLDNAIKFTPPHGHIEVSLKDRKGYVEIFVADSGVGVDKEQITQIFDRFYRAEKSRSSSGNGLGLSLVKSIVQALNGEISVRSKPREGSTFQVILPKENLSS